MEAVESGANNGYTQASGSAAAREAIAKKFSSADHPVDPNNVILTFGTSGALYNAISVLCERGTEVLVARPGFPLCQPICENLDVNYVFYDLDPEK